MATLPMIANGMTSSIATTPHATLFQKFEGVFEKDGKKVLTVMEVAANEFAKGLTWLAQYAPAVAALVDVFFPQAAAETTAAAAAIDLIQKAVLQVEASYAAAGINSETGAKKAADVLTLVESTVTALLAQLNIKANTAYIENIVNGVVAILNVQATTVAG